jgi:hypothetical protein
VHEAPLLGCGQGAYIHPQEAPARDGCDTQLRLDGPRGEGEIRDRDEDVIDVRQQADL